MRKTPLPFRSAESEAIPVNDLSRHAKSWLLDSEVRQLSKATVENRRIVLDKLIWWLRFNECAECGLPELRQFLAYLTTGHENEHGRWGNPNLTCRPKPGTAATYFARLRS